METINCKWCSVSFTRYRSRKRQFCSRDCFSQYRTDLLKKNGHIWGWKGDDAGYHALHKWIIAQKGKPNMCELCGTKDSTRYEWANKSREYKRDFSDWMRLCISCHRKMDRHEKMPDGRFKKGSVSKTI